jgi:antitoxin ParD1/3/4
VSTIEKISIALPPEMVSIVRQAVDDGEYASSSEVIREALRDWNQKRTLRAEGLVELRRVWQQALTDNQPGVVPEEVIARLEQKYRRAQSLRGQSKECVSNSRGGLRATSKQLRISSQKTIPTAQSSF